MRFVRTDARRLDRRWQERRVGEAAGVRRVRNVARDQRGHRARLRHGIDAAGQRKAKHRMRVSLPFAKARITTAGEARQAYRREVAIAAGEKPRHGVGGTAPRAR